MVFNIILCSMVQEVEMVESAIDDIFDEYDYFLDQLNSIPS